MALQIVFVKISFPWLTLFTEDLYLLLVAKQSELIQLERHYVYVFHMQKHIFWARMNYYYSCNGFSFPKFCHYPHLSGLCTQKKSKIFVKNVLLFQRKLIHIRK